MSDDQLQRHTPRRKTVLLPVVGLLALAGCGMALLALSTARVGIQAEVVGIVAALVPVGPVVAAFLWVDRWEPEPAKLLWLGFGWGACVAAITALLINNTAEAVGDLLLGQGGGDAISAMVSAPLFEEFMKGAFVYGIYLFLRHEFDGVIDGIVYAGLVAAGFAFTENIYYFGRAFADYGIGDGTSPGVVTAFILRGVLSPFTHPLFTACIGIGIGFAARGKHRVLAPALGFAAAVLLHAAWNGAATLGGGTAFLTVYFLVMVPLFAVAVWFITWHRRREQRIIAAALPVMVEQNLILDNEVEALSRLDARRKWRKRVRARSGREAAARMAEYHAAVSELAFLRHSAHEGHSGKHDLTDEAHLVAVVRATRQVAVRASAR